LPNYQHGAVNLGQGFPNFPPPDFVLNNLASVIQQPLLSQYTRSQGYLGLVEALSKYYSGWMSHEINPLTEVEVTVGATQALYLSLMATVNPGDEVILIQPFYDSYAPVIEMAGGKPVYVPLRTADGGLKASNWILDMDELKRAVNNKTKMIVVNTPQNCPGKVYTKAELQAIADLAISRNLLVMSDDSYDSLTYDGVELTKLASLPGMWERTITVGSAGKTFSVTGWKIGWVIAPAALLRPLGLAQQQIPFCVATPLQAAVAQCLQDSETNNYFQTLKKEYQGRRDLLMNALASSGLTPVKPQGSYFVLADISAVHQEAYYDRTDPTPRDHQFCRWLTKVRFLLTC
jgi:kynurenine--oxoglutarate transaminase/cysteine-S-conjugate beta-lyase/glutamine--phenylpyruvate transaminase